MISRTDVEVITAHAADEQEGDDPLSHGVNCAGIFDSQLVRHAGGVPVAPLYVNLKTPL